MLARSLAAVLLCLVFAAPATAAPSAAPCWKRVTLDWAADGKVDRAYPRACYEQAVKNMTPDLELYSSFPDDMRRALQRASSGGTTTGEDPTLTSASGETDDGSSVPLPLILLGGAAVLLVVAGVGGMLWRRTRNRPAGA